MAGASGGKEESLLYSGTWAIAATCLLFILVSLFFEQALEFAEHLILKYKQTSLQAAFDKIKGELLLVGFISIALTVGQSSVAKICIPIKASTFMPLCKKSSTYKASEHFAERILAGATPTPGCSKDHGPLIPIYGFHQLHIFIFILALVHIVYSLMIMALGMLSVSYWKVWEKRAHSFEEISTHDDIRLARETTFMRARIPIRWMRRPIIAHVVAFFHQFRNSVTETDYLTLRHGFIKTHTPGHIAFDFHKYIMRSLQDDFQHVVGISPALWLFVIAWILFNVDGWETNFLTTLITLALVLIIGTKMQLIITTMALRSSKKNHVVLGLPDVKPSDDLFWFNRPHFTRWCIHFILLQNALDVSFILWTKYTFPGDNCVYQKKYRLIVGLIIGILTQMICGLVTLPTYALVSQMGSNPKRTIFEKDIQLALDKWRRQAKANVHQRNESSHEHTSHVEMSHSHTSHVKMSQSYPSNSEIASI